MTATITTVNHEPARDRWGRPLVIPPGGGKATPYTRCTTFIDCLDDRYNLELWKIRQAAIGLTERPDLHLAVSAHRDDKKKLDKICNDAIEAAKSSAAATTGTALHSLTELVDAGRDLPGLPDSAKADLEAYREGTAALTVVAMEQFGVHDELKVAGTWDRLVEYQGQRFIADLKTGSTIDYSLGKIAMQLAIYSRCQVYDVPTGQRTPLDVYPNAGLVIHLPAGQARCDLHWVDLKAGWEGVQLAAQVRAWRKRKGLASPFAA
jgi:hypothetical protein